MTYDCASLPPCSVVPIDDALGEMLIFAVRYSLGRRTYAAGDTARYVAQIVPHLSSRDLRVIEKDITGFRTLGDPVDEEAWLWLLAAVRKELQRRKTCG